MNEILNGNIEAIQKYDSLFSERILSITSLTKDISFCETNLKEPNLSINGVHVHSPMGAEEEAKSIFKKSEDSANFIHIIYGIGIGFLFKEFADHAQGTVILYEPDLEALRVTLEVVDFKQELSKKNVFVATDLEALEHVFYSKYAYLSKVKCHFLTYHREHCFPEIEQLVKELTRFNSILSSNYSFQKKQNYSFINNTLDGFEKKIESIPLHLLQDKFKNIPAVIVSAGPSLSKNIEILKQYQDNVLIFCVGTAYKTLAAAGIKPDFLHAIERHDSSSQISGFDLSDINYVHEGYTNKTFMDLKKKKAFITLSQENVANVWLADLMEMDAQMYETRGTVSYNALFSAHLLGCNPLILIGQDLAFADGKLYADNSAYTNLKYDIDEETGQPKIYVDDIEKYRQESFTSKSKWKEETQYKFIEMRLNDLNNAVMFTKGQNGERLVTEQGYALFIEYFKDFAKKYGESKILINSSKGGAQIDGFSNVELKEVLSLLTDKKPNTDEIIDKINYTPDYKTILTNLKNEISLINETLDYFKNAQNDVKNYKREILRYRTLTERAAKFLKNALSTFMTILNGPKQQSHIVSAITKDEESNLSWYLKENDNKYDYETQVELIKLLEEYFFNNHKKFTDTKEEIVKIVTALEERVITFR